MYNLNDIQEKFFTDKLITFKSSFNSASNLLDSDLTGVSKSKRYFNVGVHPLISIENIEAFTPDLSDYEISAYAAGTTYSKYNETFSLSDIVSSGGKYYISVANTNLGQSVTDTAYWKETTLLSLILKDKIRSAIEVVLAETIKPNVIEDNVYMYRIADTTDDLIENDNKLVGLRIYPNSSDHLLFIINQLGLHFEGSETITFTLYNQNESISTFDLTSVANRFTWNDITPIEITSNTGAWYLFYDQSSLSSRAVGNNSIFYNYMTKGVNITPFQVSTVSDFDSFSESDLVYDKNFGMNLNYTTSYDLTSFIKQHLDQFAEAIQKQFEFDMVNLFCYNPDAESELRQRNVSVDRLMYELKNFEGNTVARQLRSAYQKIKSSLTRLGYKDNAFKENIDDNFSISSI